MILCVHLWFPFAVRRRTPHGRAPARSYSRKEAGPMGVGVGLDPGADGMKVVKVRAGPGGVSILSAARLERPGEGGFPADELLEAMRRARIPRKAVLGVSGRDVMLRYVPVPPVPPWRLRMLVEFEIRENMAKGGEGISSDYRPLALPTGLEEGLVVLVAVAKDAYLEEAISRSRSAGVRVNTASPSAIALYRGFIASGDFKPGEATFLLDIGRDCMEMAIQKDGDLYFARNTTGGGERVTHSIDGAFGIGRDRAEAYKRDRSRLSLRPPPDADKRQLLVYGALREAGDAIVTAVSSGLRFARMQTKMRKLDFDRLVLSGGGARLAGLQGFLENRLEKPVTLYDPAAALDSSRLTAEGARAFGGAPSEMAVATGLAIMDASAGGFSLSLLPPREVARRDFWRRKVFGYAAGAVAAGLAAAMFLRVRTDLSAAKAEHERIDGEVTALRARAEEVAKLEKENRLARREVGIFLEKARVNKAVLEFLKLQRAACPEGLSLTKLELSDPADLRVMFEGRAQGLDEQTFLARLDDFRKGFRDPLIREGSVNISQISVRAKKNAPDVRAFRCSLSLKPWVRSGAARGDILESAAAGEGGR